MKIGAIIQARHGSSRLPGKVLKSLPFDSKETILSQIFNRLNTSKRLDEVIIATSDQINDDIIESYAKEKNIICVRGSENNVLERFVKAIEERKLDVVVRVTGDNPVVLIDILDNALAKHIEANVDYTRNQNLPYGTSFEIVNAEVLKDVFYNEITTVSEQEHVTVYIKTHQDKFKTQEIEHDLERIDFRFTVDYPSDYAAINLVFQFLNRKGYNYNYRTLQNFVKEHQWISDINKANLQKKQFQELGEEIEEAIKTLESLEMKNAVEILKKGAGIL